MKILPANTVIDKADLLSDNQKDTFVDQHNIQTVEMELDNSLWRFVSQKNKNRFSDCWVDSETMKSLMDVFRSWNDYSQNTKKKVVRDNLAILAHWSHLNWRVKITFKKNVIAYVGSTGAQKHFSEDAEMVQMFKSQAIKASDHRIGGFKQYVIPRFKGISEDNATEFASVTHFAHL